MNKNIIVGRWLLVGVVLLMIQVLLGGITRLTGSGLSITEWKPLLGALPPMNETDWQIVFEKYKLIPQSKYLNADFSLADFKFIYFWEWFHRNWARLISVVFLIPFFYFLWKRMITKEMVPKLIGLFALGLAQGLIGWIMVASGLNDDSNLYVSHIRLAIHFVSAMVLIAFTCWFALSLLISADQKVTNPGLRNFSIAILTLLCIQLVYGAFMAGLKAASVASTWPSINGDYFPQQLLNNSFVHDSINIHFIHRTLAYIILILILMWFWQSRKIISSTLFSRYRWWPLILVFCQVLLGILSLLYSKNITRNGLGLFENLALFHQLNAMILVMCMVGMTFILNGKKMSLE